MITTTNPKIMNEIQRMIRGNKKNQDCQLTISEVNTQTDYFYHYFSIILNYLS